MDQTPGHIRARQITTDEKEELMRTGRCFNCKEQGHLSQYCPKKRTGTTFPANSATRPQPRARAAQVTVNFDDGVEDTEPEAAVKATSSQKSLTADQIIELMQNASEEDKDKVIQKVFMASDF